MVNYTTNTKYVPSGFVLGKILAVIFVLLLIGTALGSYFTVDAGQSAIKLRFGKIMGSYEEGLHFKIPFIDTIEKFSTRVNKDTIDTEAFSRDLQTIKVGLAVNHRIMPETVVSIYRNLGRNYVQTVLTPMVEEWIKAIVSKYSAESLISNRVEVARELDSILKEKMKEKQVIVSDIAIVNFDFSPQFLKAVEDKQIAEQEAKRATNLVEKVKKEAEQQVLKAKAEAESLKLQRQVITPELLKLKTIEKWNGQLPTYNGGELPFIMIK